MALVQVPPGQRAHRVAKANTLIGLTFALQVLMTFNAIDRYSPPRIHLPACIQDSSNKFNKNAIFNILQHLYEKENRAVHLLYIL